jgi:histidinol phosphatase-like PHP family hydrolase
MPWFKGNFHCHSSCSDGRATPEDVLRFYRFQNYDFIGVSDHNMEYARLRISSTSGAWAWCQPVFKDEIADAERWTSDD